MVLFSHGKGEGLDDTAMRALGCNGLLNKRAPGVPGALGLLPWSAATRRRFGTLGGAVVQNPKAVTSPRTAKLNAVTSHRTPKNHGGDTGRISSSSEASSFWPMRAATRTRSAFISSRAKILRNFV